MEVLGGFGLSPSLFVDLVAKCGHHLGADLEVFGLGGREA